MCCFVVMMLMNGWYFVDFLSKVYVVNLSLQYVNSINCMVISNLGFCGWGWLYGWPMTRSLFGLNLVLQSHLWVPHVHGNNHVGTVFS